MRILFACLTLFLLGWSAQAETTDPVVTAVSPVIQNFHALASGKIYRGSLPGSAGLAALAAAGVRTVIDLQGGDKILGIPLEAGESAGDIAQEKKDTTSDGMVFISEPMSAINPDFDDQDSRIEEVLALISDPANQPVYFHCRHGSDRTGVVAALYRVLDQQCTPSQAHQEMMEDGHSTLLPWIDDYFEDRVAQDPDVHVLNPGPDCPLNQ